METNEASATAATGTLRYLQIGGDDLGIATVTEDLKRAVVAGDIAAELEKLAKSGQKPAGSEWSRGCSAGGKEFAGIHIAIDLEESGPYAIMLRLEASWGEFPGLRFIKATPFVELPVNEPHTEIFLAASKCYENDTMPDEHLRWASFTCDLTRARQSSLADKITSLPPKSHNNALRVPFTYNAVDPGLGFSPWVLGEHGRPIVTHGGVHPHVANYLVIELDPKS
ncbi:hypothetical protein Q9Q95_03345 [Sphingomonas sp. DG1-23]|uniref:hypothetical protein n=1 Tax=Sphingomonas sp. DG1-23 TaxID=3068316 RepID=UPI00273D6B85|nr:hypothetical protein [Sphingomonas sp. DG1-23]MDP5277947.1 hypothetical protein [Sphingomonas sp. DG1-23]